MRVTRLVDAPIISPDFPIKKIAFSFVRPIKLGTVIFSAPLESGDTIFSMDCFPSFKNDLNRQNRAHRQNGGLACFGSWWNVNLLDFRYLLCINIEVITFCQNTHTVPL